MTRSLLYRLPLAREAFKVHKVFLDLKASKVSRESLDLKELQVL
jgi:hypothetical protein